jgi:hypothetical protein
VSEQRKVNIVRTWIRNIPNQRENGLKVISGPISVELRNDRGRMNKVAVVKVVVIVESMPEIDSWVSYSRAVWKGVVTRLSITIERA